MRRSLVILVVVVILITVVKLIKESAVNRGREEELERGREGERESGILVEVVVILIKEPANICVLSNIRRSISRYKTVLVAVPGVVV